MGDQHFESNIFDSAMVCEQIFLLVNGTQFSVHVKVSEYFGRDVSTVKVSVTITKIETGTATKVYVVFLPLGFI